MTLIEQLKTIPDPRGKRGQRHPLCLALFISPQGSLCGYWGYRPLAKFSKKHRQTLVKLLNLDPHWQKFCQDFSNTLLAPKPRR